MGTADVQAFCNVLKEEEDSEKKLVAKLNGLLKDNGVSDFTIYFVINAVLIFSHISPQVPSS
jgi:hypothetical protein